MHSDESNSSFRIAHGPAIADLICARCRRAIAPPAATLDLSAVVGRIEYFCDRCLADSRDPTVAQRLSGK